MVERLLSIGRQFADPTSLKRGLLAVQRGNYKQCRSFLAAKDTLASPRRQQSRAHSSLRGQAGDPLPIPLGMGQKLSLKSSQCSVGSVLRAQDRDAALERDSVGTAPSGVWIVVGLGNPGPKFAGNRHNVGFMTVDLIAKRAGLLIEKKLCKAAVARCKFGGHNLLLAKPLTYMNLSGESVSALAKFYKVPTDKIIIIYDDLDTPLGMVKLKQKGGHGGHNGIRSLGAHLKGDFPRIKIGVGRPPGSRTVIDHVLQDFTAKERPEVDHAVDEAIHVLESILRLGMQRALSGMRC